ncbi:MAG: hypothetical protein WAU62_01960 [Dehalococcoidales bacterium]
MKKIAITIFFVLAIIILIAMPVLADAYTCQITMVESSGNSYSNMPFSFPVSNSALVSGAYLSSSGLDGKVIDGSSVPTMITSTQTLFVDNLPANGSKNIQYTTGNTPGTSMPIIVGNDGSISAAAYQVGDTLTNGTGTATGSPITLLSGANTITTTGSVGTFTLFLSPGNTATATSGASCQVTGSPLTLNPGTTTITTTGSVGTFTITVNATGFTAGNYITNKTGVLPVSPFTLATYGANTVTVNGVGTFTVVLSPSTSGTATSGVCLVTGSPVTLNPGINTITTTSFTGAFTITTMSTLEPGSNFSISATGYMNTASPVTTGNTIVNGPGGQATGSPITLASGANTITSTAPTLTGSTVVNGTGVATGSPVTLVGAGNTITVSTLGTFTVTLGTGLSGYATSGVSCLVTGSPAALTAGSNTITTTGSTGTFTITIYGTFTLVLQSGISGTVTSSGATIVGSPVSIVQGTNTIMTTTVGTFTVTLNETKNIVSKASALSVYVDPTTSGTIDATGIPILQSTGSGNIVASGTGSSTEVTQDFTTNSLGGTLSNIQIYANVGVGGSSNVYLYATSGGKPTGSSLASGSCTLSSTPGWTTATMSSYVMSGNTTYAIVATLFGGGYTEYLYGITAAGSGFYLSTNSGSTWTLQSGYQAAYIIGFSTAQILSITGVSSGLGTLSLSLSSGTMTLSWTPSGGSVNSATVTGIGTVGITSNSNNWYIDQNNVMPYITSYSESVGGVQKLLYQPAAMISGVCLPDIDNSEAASMTFGSNSGGVTITVGALAPTTPAQAMTGNSYAIQSPGSILSSTLGLPPQMYTELDASLIPFGGAINAILAAGNVPQALWWMPFIYIFICIIGMLVYEATGPKGAPQVGSLLAMCVAIEILLVLFAVLGTVGVSGMIPLWSAILFIFPAAALIFSRRHVGWG